LLTSPLAHLNLRDQLLPYRYLIAKVLADKAHSIKTVINKIDNVGKEDPFRTFPYEVLIGPDDLNVQVRHENCLFEFDYSKVYWNTRLQAEHHALVAMFNEGEAVCDVMAGIGPFSVPAGKQNIFSYANDLNPQSYKYMVEAIKTNKVSYTLYLPVNDPLTCLVGRGIREAVQRRWP
jgi:tRNA (guanine37-N1)-methyltransferase